MKHWLLISLLFSSVAQAQTPDIIAGGPRQAFDAAHCNTYRGLWPEFNIWVASIPETYQYGPEMPTPLAPAENTNDPIAARAVKVLQLHAVLNPRYRAAGYESIGYDQYFAAFVRAYDLPIGTPTRLAMPLPGDISTPEKLRQYRVRNAVWMLSLLGALDLQQLADIEAVLLTTPTCGGVAY